MYASAMSEEGWKIIHSMSHFWKNFMWTCRNPVFLSDEISVTLNNSLFRRSVWGSVITLYTEQVWVFSHFNSCTSSQEFCILICCRVSDLVSDVRRAVSPPSLCLSGCEIRADCYGHFQTSLVLVKPLWGPQKEGAMKCSIIPFMKMFVKFLNFFWIIFSSKCLLYPFFHLQLILPTPERGEMWS